MVEKSGDNSVEGRPIGLMVASIVCSVIAVLFVPLLFGGLAIFFGYRAYKVDEGIGKVCMTIGGIALIVGVIAGALIGMQTYQF